MSLKRLASLFFFTCFSFQVSAHDVSKGTSFADLPKDFQEHFFADLKSFVPDFTQSFVCMVQKFSQASSVEKITSKTWLRDMVESDEQKQALIDSCKDLDRTTLFYGEFDLNFGELLTTSGYFSYINTLLQKEEYQVIAREPIDVQFEDEDQSIVYIQVLGFSWPYQSIAITLYRNEDGSVSSDVGNMP